MPNWGVGKNEQISWEFLKLSVRSAVNETTTRICSTFKIDPKNPKFVKYPAPLQLGVYSQPLVGRPVESSEISTISLKIYKFLQLL